MMRVLLLLALPGMLAGIAGAAPLTAKEARDSAAQAVELILDINNTIAETYFHTGEWNKTVAALERVIALNPSDINAYANAAWLLWSSGNTDAAIALYQRMVEKNPSSSEAYYVYGSYHYFRRQWKEALPLLEQAVKLGVPSPKNHLYGHCLEKLERKQDALAFWRQLLTADPRDEVAKKQLDKLTAPAPDAKTP